MDQKQTGSQPAFYHNKSKHTKSPERFSAIKTPTPSPASISGSCAPSLPPSLHPTPPSLVQLSALPPSLSCYRSPRCISSISLFSFFPLFASLSFCHPLFTPYSLALALSLLLLHEHLPLPPTHTHTHSSFSFFFKKKNQPLTHVCLHPSLPLF